MKTLSILLLLLSLSFGQGTKSIHTDEFYQILPFSLVIDLRTPSEYGIAQIKGARNVPLNSPSFRSEIINLLSESSARQVVLYGNTEAQAQEAGKQLDGYVNCFVYPKGLQYWLHKHPQFSLLQGKRFNPKEIISPKEHYSKLFKAKAFKRRARNATTILLAGDSQKKHSRIIKDKAMNFRTFLSEVANGSFQEKPLYLAGLSPEQSLWIMYFLQENGIKNFGFLR